MSVPIKFHSTCIMLSPPAHFLDRGSWCSCAVWRMSIALIILYSWPAKSSQIYLWSTCRKVICHKVLQRKQRWHKQIFICKQATMKDKTKKGVDNCVSICVWEYIHIYTHMKKKKATNTDWKKAVTETRMACRHVGSFYYLMDMWSVVKPGTVSGLMQWVDWHGDLHIASRNYFPVLDYKTPEGNSNRQVREQRRCRTDTVSAYVNLIVYFIIITLQAKDLCIHCLSSTYKQAPTYCTFNQFGNMYCQA